VTSALPDQRLSEVISEAAFDPSKWIDVCDGFSQLLGGYGALILPEDEESRPLGMPHSPCLEEGLKRYIEEEWYKGDLRNASLPLYHARGYVSDEDYIAYDAMDKSDYYQDFLRPLGLRWFAGIGFTTDLRRWTLSIQRKFGGNPFEKSEIRKAFAYRDHLSNSAVISRQLGFAKMCGAAGALEQQGLCAIALDAGERVVYVSPSAERHLHDGLEISGSRLRASRPAEAVALSRFAKAICRKDTSLSHLHVSIARSDGRWPLVLYGCALPEAQCDIFRPAVALLVISDPDRTSNVPLALLMDYFGLTRAEADLAAALFKGASVEQHAIRTGVSRATARNHLQVLLHKTGTHRQGELIALLGRIVPPR
jgi:DNA-binding CsgD family transcriptional regulator